MNSFYDNDELKRLGLKSIGENVLISRKASIYGAKSISIGHNVRIDDFCILSGTISIGRTVHKRILLYMVERMGFSLKILPICHRELVCIASATIILVCL